MLLRKGIVFALVLVFLQIQSCFSNINRGSFPAGFAFGTASSAYQYEGAVKADGRGLTIWDTFSYSFGKIADFSNGDVAVDQYHRFTEDIQLMKDMGMDAYRFSIAWSRIFPNGSGEINQAGIDHYNRLINALIAKGIEPYVTIYHWDLPQALEDKYTGWLSPNIIKDFATYAETCFQKFGDRVKHWITFNEPHNYAIQGYDVGLEAPGRCSILLRLFCRAGNSATEPYIVAHNVLLSHATVADIYRKKYKKQQHGSVGISLDVVWYEPRSNSTDDIKAAHRAQDFQFGCLQRWKSNRRPGMDDPNNPFISIKDALKDEKRIKYHNDYLSNLLASIKEDGCNVRGYFAWSLLDNWEWAAGYTSRFGLFFVDYKDNLKRYPKDSVQWFKKFLTST
ncbi:hypothetical protein HHK36_030166 [Tetracentron sinense]|uniref:Beta-glucosidase n=1 Tax=Tetracentron sinense TaxID=13715 RepID=A0A835D020_TETSI|nr:hypothetical protein HHK36_030166 [Tetracentron sinense]